MNSSDVAWLEKLFGQYKEDQQKYLDEKFETLKTKIEDLCKDLNEREEDCKSFREGCMEETKKCINCLSTQVDECAANATKKSAISAGVAIFLSLLLWTAFGTKAFSHVVAIFTKIPIP